jgi:DNA polymerase-3 subunit gamma/tau
MTSQSLYRKWRSQKFDELIGQEPIVRTLKNALSSGKPAHAYLFTGPRGTGKTSTARLLAKTINCANPKDGEPCNQCQQCREITAGSSFNVIEIDAASNRGIDNIRDLREKVMMPPATGKYKVYVLDEAHMLTPEAFNALLKTLEEPPSYAIFVLATTDVHKMLPTVLSRCQRFDFKRFSTRQIVEHLNFVAGQEHVQLEQAAAELIARAAAGGMRDALSLLDQAIAYAGEQISLAQVQVMLGVTDPQAISRLIMRIANLDSSGGLHQIHELSEAGADLRQINIQVVEYWRALMLAKAGADIATILDLTEDETREIMQTARHFGLEELTECARIFAQNDLMQKNQGVPQLGLELAFLECVESHRHSQAGQAPAVTPAPAVQPHSPVAQPRTPVPRAVPPAQAPADQAGRLSPPPKKSVEEVPKALPDWDDLPPLQEDYNVPEPSPVHKATPVAEDVVPAGNAGAAAAISSTAPGPADRPSLTVQQVKSAWDKVKKRAKQKNGLVAATLVHSNVIAIEGTSEEAVIVLHIEKEAHYKIVSNRLKDVEWALGVEFGQKCRVRLVTSPQSSPPVLFSEISDFSVSAEIASQPAARQERPAVLPSPPEAGEGEQEMLAQHVQGEPVSSADPANTTSSSPLARMSKVSENTTEGSFQETIEQRALRDPVVQEVMKTFTARIVDVRPK